MGMTTLSGPEFRRARQQLGITQVELARMVGLAASTIASFEKGRYQPHARTLRALARSLDFAPNHHTLAEQARGIQFRQGWNHRKCATLSGVSEKNWCERVWRRRRARKPHPRTTKRLALFVQKWGDLTV